MEESERSSSSSSSFSVEEPVSDEEESSSTQNAGYKEEEEEEEEGESSESRESDEEGLDDDNLSDVSFRYEPTPLERLRRSPATSLILSRSSSRETVMDWRGREEEEFPPESSSPRRNKHPSDDIPIGFRETLRTSLGSSMAAAASKAIDKDPESPVYQTNRRRSILRRLKKEETTMGQEAEDRVTTFAQKVIQKQHDPEHLKMIRRIFNEKKEKYDKYVETEGLKRWSQCFESPTPSKAVMTRPLEFKAQAVNEAETVQYSPEPGSVVRSSPIIQLRPCAVMPRKNYFTCIKANFKARDTNTLSHIPYVGDRNHDEEAFTDELVGLYHEGVHGTRSSYRKGINDRILYEMLISIDFQARDGPILRDRYYAALHYLFPDKCALREIHKQAISLYKRFDQLKRLPYSAPGSSVYGMTYTQIEEEEGVKSDEKKEESIQVDEEACKAHDQYEDPTILTRRRVRSLPPPSSIITEPRPCSFLCHQYFEERMKHQEENIRLKRWKNGEWKPFWYKITLKQPKRRALKRAGEEEEETERSTKRMRRDESWDEQEDGESDEVSRHEREDQERSGEEEENEDEEEVEDEDNEIDEAMDDLSAPSSRNIRSERTVQSEKKMNGKIKSRNENQSNHMRRRRYKDRDENMEMRSVYGDGKAPSEKDCSASSRSSRRCMTIAESMQLLRSLERANVIRVENGVEDKEQEDGTSEGMSKEESRDNSSADRNGEIHEEDDRRDARSSREGSRISEEKMEVGRGEGSDGMEELSEGGDGEDPIEEFNGGSIIKDEVEDDIGVKEAIKDHEDMNGFEESVADDGGKKEAQGQHGHMIKEVKRETVSENGIDEDGKATRDESVDNHIQFIVEADEDDVLLGRIKIEDEDDNEENYSSGDENGVSTRRCARVREFVKPWDSPSVSSGEEDEENEDEEEEENQESLHFDEEIRHGGEEAQESLTVDLDQVFESNEESDKLKIILSMSSDEEEEKSEESSSGEEDENNDSEDDVLSEIRGPSPTRERSASSHEEDDEDEWSEESGWEDEVIEDDVECTVITTRRAFHIDKNDVPPTEWRKWVGRRRYPNPFRNDEEEQNVIDCLNQGESVCDIVQGLKVMWKRLGYVRECYQVQAYLKSQRLFTVKKEYEEELDSTLADRLKAWRSFNATTEMNNDNALRPCSHPGKCDEQKNPPCECFRLDIPCTKFCSCDVRCLIKFPGCTCPPGLCRSRQCPCYYASWECDPETCTACCCDEEDEPECSRKKSRRQCQNRQISLGKKKRIFAARSEIAGIGAFIGEKTRKGELIEEYVGEIISVEESERRGHMYDKLRLSYTFTLNDDQVVDATRAGNVARFINHSRYPNCLARVFVVNGEHRIGIFARRNLDLGEELFFNYGYKREHAEAFTNKERDGCDPSLLMDDRPRGIRVEDPPTPSSLSSSSSTIGERNVPMRQDDRLSYSSGSPNYDEQSSVDSESSEDRDVTEREEEVNLYEDERRIRMEGVDDRMSLDSLSIVDQPVNIRPKEEEPSRFEKKRETSRIYKLVGRLPEASM